MCEQTISDLLQPTPSKSQVNVHPFPLIGVEHLDNNVVHHHNLTQRPEGGSQGEVVDQGGHYLAGNLSKRWRESRLNAVYAYKDKILLTVELTSTLFAPSIPTKNTSSAHALAVHKFKPTNCFKFWRISRLSMQELVLITKCR